MPNVDVLYHLPQGLSERECAKLEHILRHFRGVTSAQLCPNSPHTINVEYDRETTDAETLLNYLKTLDERTSMLSL